MGGFEATSQIRKIEQSRNSWTPVIAMTAHAMKGDREACLEAGMDDYISKPIKSKELFEVIAKALEASARRKTPRQRQPESNVAVNNGTPQKPAAPSIPWNKILDVEAVLARVDNDRDLLREIAGLFLESCPILMAEIRKGIDLGDEKLVESSAHTLKGSVSNFFARRAVKASLRLEEIGSACTLDRAEAAFQSLEEEIALLEPALHSFQNGETKLAD
jgi:response regulator RpfG family c-di-GMP phosphodiesterase